MNDRRGGTPQLWLWAAGTECGLSDDEERAREDAEAAVLRRGCVALLELVTVGLDDNLEPQYVHTAIAYSGQPTDGRVGWLPAFSGAS